MTLLALKLRRDLRATRGRVAAVALTLAVSCATVLGLVHARDRLLTAMADNTRRTVPAHAQLMGARPDAATLAALRALPGVADARTGGSARARAGTRRVMLFALPDTGEPAFARPLLTAGRWPGPDEVLIERDGTAWVGEALALDDGPRLRVSGEVHDPMLAPSSTEGVVYGYLRASTLARLPHADFTLLRYHAPRDQADVDARTRQVLDWLAAHGVTVDQPRVPPLGEHPHQRQADGALQMLLACAALGLLVSVLAAAVLLRGLMERQRAQIGVLRVLGASNRALLTAHLYVLSQLAAACLLAATLLGLAGGEGLARVSARLLNLELVPRWPGPAWWAAWLLCAVLPLLAAAPGLWQALRHPVRLALGRPELSRSHAVGRAPLRHGPVFARLALRNLLRRRRRYGLAVLLLAVAGAVFMGSLGLREAWLALIDQGEATRRHQVELRLSHAVAGDTWLALPEVLAAEPWATQTATWAGDGQTPLARTHADGGHGQLLLRLVPPGPTMLAPESLQGRWPPGAGEMAINRGAAALLGRPARLGELLTLSTAQGPVQARVSGIFDEALAPASAYLPAAPASADDPATQWRLRLRPGTPPGAWLRDLPSALASQVIASTTGGDHRRAALGHVLVLVRSLGLVALATALVGLLTLASSLGNAVAERRGEFAVLRSLGATAGLLARSVMLEGAAVALLSVGVAWALRPVLERWLVAELGTLSGQPLQPAGAWMPLITWLCLATAGGLVASALPARAAHRSPLKPALESA